MLRTQSWYSEHTVETYGSSVLNYRSDSHKRREIKEEVFYLLFHFKIFLYAFLSYPTVWIATQKEYNVDFRHSYSKYPEHLSFLTNDRYISEWWKQEFGYLTTIRNAYQRSRYKYPTASILLAMLNRLF